MMCRPREFQRARSLAAAPAPSSSGYADDPIRNAITAGSEREPVLDVVEQPLDAPRADLRARDVQRRLAVEQGMRAIQERPRLALLVPEALDQRHDARQALGPLALVRGQARAALECGGRNDAVDELVHRGARF